MKQKKPPKPHMPENINSAPFLKSLIRITIIVYIYFYVFMTTKWILPFP